MTFEDFQRNLRGVNGSVDFAPQYLVCHFFLSLRKFTNSEPFHSEAFLIASVSEKLLCPKNILARLDLITRGKN